MTREEVYKEIDIERDYQDHIWGGPIHDKGHSIGDFIIFMEEYIKKSKTSYTKTIGNDDCLNQLRKVIALGIACFEAHGCPSRTITW